MFAVMSGSTANIKVISGGAFKQVLNALAAQYEKESGNTLALTYRTVGQHLQLIKSGGEPFDVAVLTPEAIDGLIKDGKVVAGSRADLAKTGVGVVVRAGTPLPDIGSVDAFKRSLLAAKSVAYIDPAAGGSSGIYVGRLLERLGIAAAVNAKVKLIHGGAVADHIAEGEAEIGIHQVSEILPVKGVVLVGPLPADIQNFTVYAAGVGHRGQGQRCRQCPGQVPGRAARGADHQGQGHGAGILSAPIKSQRPQEAGAGLRR
jgi:molybdate transport system substrate-binding protein